MIEGVELEWQLNLHQTEPAMSLDPQLFETALSQMDPGLMSTSADSMPGRVQAAGGEDDPLSQLEQQPAAQAPYPHSYSDPSMMRYPSSTTTGPPLSTLATQDPAAAARYPINAQPSDANHARILAQRAQKKEIKRRTKTGCLTCRKRRIKVSRDPQALLLALSRVGAVVVQVELLYRDGS